MILKVPENRIIYSPEPEDPLAYTTRVNQAYTHYAKAYDLAVKLLPVWRTWLKKVIPYIDGKRVLEASFGTGYLLLQYASQYETYGIDCNARMVEIAKDNLFRKGVHATLLQGNVENLPFPENFFDCIVNTMSFTGYPSGERVMGEFHRTLRPGGKLILLDFNYPSNRNLFGYLLTKFMKRAGDIIRDICRSAATFRSGDP